MKNINESDWQESGLQKEEKSTPYNYTKKLEPFNLKRTGFFMLLFLCSGWLLFAHDVNQAMLYPDYQQGFVYFKDGRRSSVLLNYNTEVEEMLYKKDSIAWAIANPEEIAVIDIQGDKFVYFKRKVFYQLVETGLGTLYIEWKSVVVSQGKASGYGGYSSTAAISSYSSIREGGTITKLSPNEKFTIQPGNRYWIKNKKGKYMNVTTLSLIQKNFPDKDIKTYCQKNKLDCMKPSDMKRIMAYCFQ